MHTFEIKIHSDIDGYCLIDIKHSADTLLLPTHTQGKFNTKLISEIHKSLHFTDKEYGLILGKTIFSDSIKDLFISAYGISKIEDNLLNTFITVNEKSLLTVHWERLHAPFDGEWDFLILNRRTPFSILVPTEIQWKLRSIKADEISSLALVAGPEDLLEYYKLPFFDIKATLDNITNSLGKLNCDTLSRESESLGPPTLDELCHQLGKKHYSILHITCHGTYNKENGDTILFFPKNNQGKPVSAKELITRLRRLNGLVELPRFIFLSNCDSGAPIAENGLGSLARRLVKEVGIPAVLAMTDKISIATAQKLNTLFFNSLISHGDPSKALVESMISMQGNELSIPSIFCRANSLPVFDLSNDLSIVPVLEDITFLRGVNKFSLQCSKQIELYFNQKTNQHSSAIESKLHQLDESLTLNSKSSNMFVFQIKEEKNLLLHWVDRLKNRTDLDIIFLPAEILTTIELLGVLTARLAFITSSVFLKENDMSDADWIHQIFIYLSYPLSENKILLIIIDKLNEYLFAELSELFRSLPRDKVRIVIGLEAASNNQDVSSRLIKDDAILSTRYPTLEKSQDQTNSVTDKNKSDKESKMVISYRPEQGFKNNQTFKRFISDTKDLGDDWLIAKLLIKISRDVSDDLMEDFLDTVKGIKNESARARILIEISRYIPERLRREFIVVAQKIENRGIRGFVFLSCMQSIPEDRRAQLMEDAIDDLNSLSDQWEKAKILTTVSKGIPENYLTFLLESTLEIKDEGAQARVLIEIIKYAPVNLLSKILFCAEKIKLAEIRVIVLATLAKKMPFPTAQNVFSYAILSAREIKNEWNRARVLNMIGQTISDDQRTDLIGIAQEIKDTGARKLASGFQKT